MPINSHSPSMINITGRGQKCVWLMAAMAIAGCGQSTSTVPPKIAERADVIVTIDGARHTCVVALYNEPQGSIVSCSEVASFVKDELRVAKTGIYDIRTVPQVDPAEVDRVVANMQNAGYRFIGGSDPKHQ